jgi:integrase
MKQKGRHPDRVLTVVKVKSLKEPGRYADGNGVYLIVEPSGAKRWMLRIVVQGRRRDIGLGGAQIVSLAEAREQAHNLRKIARTGGDPVAERKTKAGVPTFAEAARQVHAERAAAWSNKKHAAQWINTLTDYVFPVFGDRPVNQIDTPDVLRALSPIWLNKPETARRLRQRIRAVFDWAKAAGFRSGENPVEGVVKGLPKQPDRENHHAALPYADVPQFIKDLRGSDASEPVKLAFEFLILTATRTSEVLEAPWKEFDIQSALWTIPKPRTKTKKRAHRVPLSPRCLKILERAKLLASNSEYVFPGQSLTRPLSDMVFLMTLRRMELEITAHGFRSTFKDWASERTNFPNEISEMALQHTIPNKTEAAYRRGDLFEKRRRLMAAWDRFATSSPKAKRRTKPKKGR